MPPDGTPEPGLLRWWRPLPTAGPDIGPQGETTGMADLRPHPSRQVLRAGWIMARAFTPHQGWAVLAFPWTLLAVLPATVRGGLFLDATRTGMVVLSPINLTLDLLVLLPVIGTVTAGATVGFLLVTTVCPGAVPALLVLAALLVVASLAGALVLSPGRGGSVVPFGPETPPGPRWEIAGLAQLPGTRLTALQTARRVLATVPPAGAVVVAAANTPAQFRQYQRFGFTGGQQCRVYRVIS